MTKARKISFFIASLLLVLGLFVGVLGLALMHFDLRNLDNGIYREVETVIDEEFDSIKIDASTADIRFAVSDDGTCRVVCYEHEKMAHRAEVTDGVLTIALEDNRAWYDHISFYLRSVEIVVYLPRATFDSLEISASTADVSIEGFNFGELSVRLSTGDITLTDVTADKMTLGVSSGDISLDTLTASSLAIETGTGDVMLTDTVVAALTVVTDTGDVELVRVDAWEIEITTDTGDVSGTLCSGKLFTTSTDTGDVSVPANDASGGTCSITTDTGDIDIRIVD